MNEADFTLIKRLTEINAPSGFEENIREFIADRVRPLVNELTVDQMGSLVATRHGTASKHTILVDAHMDEIGFFVKYVTSDGFLRIGKIGGQNPRILPGQRVAIFAQSGKTIPGVIADLPIHLIPSRDRKKMRAVDDLFVDCGFQDKKEALEHVALGDFLVYEQKTARLAGSRVSGKCLDDRAGCYVLVKTLEYLQGVDVPATVKVVFSAQEETGKRGITPVGYQVNPDLAVVIEAGHATDYPGVSKDKHGEINLGGGATITIGPNVHPKISRILIELARTAGIPYQIHPTGGVQSNNAAPLQVTRAGIPTGLIRVPLRYMHSNVEVIDLADANHAARLLADFIRQFEVPGFEADLAGDAKK